MRFFLHNGAFKMTFKSTVNASCTWIFCMCFFIIIFYPDKSSFQLFYAESIYKK